MTDYKRNERGLETLLELDGEIFPIKFPTSLLKGKGVISVFTLEAGEARLISILNSAKETLISFVQSLNHILKNLRANLLIFRKFSFQFKELLHGALEYLSHK